jgi:Domain of unknown function (DUF4276)
LGAKCIGRKTMIRVNVICEGATEENFVSKVLYTYLFSKGIIVTPRNIGTGSSYGRLQYNVIQWLKEDQDAWVTTLVDLYGMGCRFPGYTANKDKQAIEKIKSIEEEFKKDIESQGVSIRKFIPHFQLHEFEAMLFADCQTTEDFLSLDYDFSAGSLQLVRNNFDTPEHINDNPLTAPSKRILRIVPSYEKVADGILIAEAIGIEKIRSECRHFDDWLIIIENLK